MSTQLLTLVVLAMRLATNRAVAALMASTWLPRVGGITMDGAPEPPGNDRGAAL